MAINKDPQTALQERIIDDPDLSGLLVQREKARQSRNALNLKFKEADQKAQAGLDALIIDDLTVNDYLTEEDGRSIRIGQFTVKAAVTESNHVEYDTNPKTRRTISEIE